MPSVGPFYCETAGVIFPAAFPIELINTLSSLIPALFGVLAFFVLYRMRQLSFGTGLMAFFLTSVGIGSALWHGLRLPITLFLDVLPGVLCLLTLLFLWPTRLWNRWYGYGFFFAFFVLQYLAIYVPIIHDRNGPPVSFFIVTASVGLMLCWYTFKRSITLGWWGLAATLLAVSAAVFRSVDQLLCDLVPFGTHFLWHVFLGAAAFCGVMLIAKLEQTRLEAMRG